MKSEHQIKLTKLFNDDCPKTSPNFGHYFEDILKKKALRHISSLKSIYDPGMFTKNPRCISAYKAFFINVNSPSIVYNNFQNAVNDNDFIVFPHFDHAFNFSVDEKSYNFIVTKNTISVEDPSLSSKEKKVNYCYEKGKEKYFKYNNYYFYFDKLKINEQNCEQIFLLTQNLFMIVFSMDIEIDGFFFNEKGFNLSDFQAEEFTVCNNFEGTNISNNTYIIFEVKSGANFESLSKQIIKDYIFFNKFFQVYPKYDIMNFIIFGFLRSDKKIEHFQSNYKENFNELKKIPTPVILFRYDYFLFGENIAYEDMELGILEELKTNMKRIDTQIDYYGNILLEIQQRLPPKENPNNINNNQAYIPSQQQPYNFPQNMPNGYMILPIPQQAQAHIDSAFKSEKLELSEKKMKINEENH